MNLQNDQTFVKRGDNWREREVKVDKSAQVKESVIGAGSIISEGTTVVNSVVGRKCVISPRAVVRDSVLWDNVIVGRGVHILHSIVEMDTHVPDGSHLSRGVVLPRKTILPPNTTIQGTDTFTVYATDGPPIPSSEDSDNEDESFQIGIFLKHPFLTKRYTQPHRLRDLRNRKRFRL
jgi:translation initiation factor eIF-2B subunit epsilon